MWGFTKLSTALLAASSSPKSIKEASSKFRELYATLGEKPVVYKQASPTVKFSFVTPPTTSENNNFDEVTKDWTDEDVFYADRYMMENVTMTTVTTATTTATATGSSSTARITSDFSPVLKEIGKKYGTEKPIALYLPGLDGFGISSASWQYNDLSKTFEFWRMSVERNDRSSFGELVTLVANFIDELSGTTKSSTTTTTRPVYVIGESFGGLLTPAVALRLQRREQREGIPNPMKGMVLINPATSFDDSNWDILAPALAALDVNNDEPTTRNNNNNNNRLPSTYAILGSLTLSALIPSNNQLQQIVQTILNMETTKDPTKIGQMLSETLDSFQLTAENLPSGLLAHRISKWLMVGSSLVNPRLSTLDSKALPTLLIAGREDKLLNSQKEVERLQKLLPESETLLVRGGGHFLLDDKVNLTEAILFSKLDPLDRANKVKKFDPILDWKLPPRNVMEKQYNSSVKPQIDAFSPIFISTDSDGKRYMGLDKLPTERPLLFVSNHQLLGADLSMLFSTLLDHGITVRGLAHPILFQNAQQQPDELGGRTAGIRDLDGSGGVGPGSNFRMFGAVMVTPKNYYKVLQSGQNALLFPGGVREVFHGKNEAYQLFWPEKVDFVRTAARFNATIIPISAVGMADTIKVVLDSSEVVNLPFGVGQRAKEFAENVTAARFDTEDVNETFLPPLVVPGLPSRNYFVFGTPFSTTDLNPKDRTSCEQVYIDIQQEMKRGFTDILRARQKDPYMQPTRRLLYERVTGKKAPTFDIQEMNKKSQ